MRIPIGSCVGFYDYPRWKNTGQLAAWKEDWWVAMESGVDTAMIRCMTEQVEAMQRGWA